MQRMSFVALCFPTKHYAALGSDICALSLCENGQRSVDIGGGGGSEGGHRQRQSVRVVITLHL